MCATFSAKKREILRGARCVFVILGSTLKVDLVWNMSDMFNGLMVLPNLIGLLW
ncbi:MAG: alanine:cation symporter family protein [Eisenbergiella sp.]